MGDCLHHHSNEDIVLFTGNKYDTSLLTSESWNSI